MRTETLSVLNIPQAMDNVQNNIGIRLWWPSQSLHNRERVIGMGIRIWRADKRWWKLCLFEKPSGPSGNMS
jgi:hypothetical protein